MDRRGVSEELGPVRRWFVTLGEVGPRGDARVRAVRQFLTTLVRLLTPVLVLLAAGGAVVLGPMGLYSRISATAELVVAFALLGVAQTNVSRRPSRVCRKAQLFMPLVVLISGLSVTWTAWTHLPVLSGTAALLLAVGTRGVWESVRRPRRERG